MKKEEFVKIISKIEKYNELLDKFEEYIILDKVPELFSPLEVINSLFENLFDTETLDAINYWLYENKGFIETPEQLYDTLFYEAIN